MNSVTELPAFFKQVNDELWLVEDERENMKLSYRLKRIISAQKSPFQHVSIVESYDFGRCLVLDGVLQTTALDGYIYNEMISHIPLVTHANPQDVLVIGGGDCGVVNEISKYSQPQSIDMVEIDRLVVEQCRQHLPEVAGYGPPDKRINFIYQDGIQFVKNKAGNYDIAIIDSSDPVGPAVKLFEEEFYIDLEKSLKDDGILVCQSQSPIFHSEVLLRCSRLLKKYFPIVRTYTAVVPSYPGGLWSFTLASKKYDPLQADVLKLSKDTRYINQQLFKSCFQLPTFMKQQLDQL